MSEAGTSVAIVVTRAQPAGAPSQTWHEIYMSCYYRRPDRVSFFRSRASQTVSPTSAPLVVSPPDRLPPVPIGELDREDPVHVAIHLICTSDVSTAEVIPGGWPEVLTQLRQSVTTQ